jgi:hypothetical protein
MVIVRSFRLHREQRIARRAMVQELQCATMSNRTNGNVANQQNEENSNPYHRGTCWYGVKPTRIGGNKVCGVLGSPLCEVYRFSREAGSCEMYLCVRHQQDMQKKGFTVVKIG